MSTVLGIDLGTTNSAMAVVNEYGRPEILTNREGGRVTPSVVLFDGETPIVGEIAKQSAVSQPLDTVQFVKRHMGEPEWSFRSATGTAFGAEQISAIILKRLKDDAEAFLGRPVERAVISVPAYFDDACRTATTDAARIAGLEVVRIINEPTAAALAYGIDSDREERILVYDLGGGTFDVTIMHVRGGDFTVLATGGDRHLGGYDWDNALMAWLDERFQAAGGPSLLAEPGSEQMLRDSAVRAKHTLSGRDETNVFLRAHGFSEKVALTRATYDDLTSSLLNRTARQVEATLDDAGLSWNQVDKVLLVGGSTRMKQVSELMTVMAGGRPSMEVNPDEVVALGAALQGAVITGTDGTGPAVPIVTANGSRVPALRVQDVTAHSLGVVSHDEYLRAENAILLPRGTSIPSLSSEVFQTLSDYQQVWDCEVTEGEDRDLAYVRRVGSGQIRLTGTYTAGAPMEVALGYDANGIVHVYVRDMVTGNPLGELHVERAANLDEDTLRANQEQLGRTEVG
jgi:molecular chaperone DnaK